GSNPARTTEDLPLPEAPITATKFLCCAVSRLARSSINAFRPEKKGTWASSKNSSPRPAPNFSPNEYRYCAGIFKGLLQDPRPVLACSEILLVKKVGISCLLK